MVIGITAPTGGKIEESGEEQHVGGPEGLLGPLSCLCPPTLKAVASGASSLYFGGGCGWTVGGHCAWAGGDTSSSPGDSVLTEERSSHRNLEASPEEFLLEVKGSGLELPFTL